MVFQDSDVAKWIEAASYLHGHDHIRDTFGKVAIQRGPFMYCLEETDNGAGLYRIQLPALADFEVNSGGGGTATRWRGGDSRG